jgi:hypothetical protein
VWLGDVQRRTKAVCFVLDEDRGSCLDRSSLDENCTSLLRSSVQFEVGAGDDSPGFYFDTQCSAFHGMVLDEMVVGKRQLRPGTCCYRTTAKRVGLGHGCRVDSIVLKTCVSDHRTRAPDVNSATNLVGAVALEKHM